MYAKIHFIVFFSFQSFVCDECMMEFKSKRALCNHKKTCSGINTYNCSDCTKMFVSIETLIQHIKKNHMVIKFLHSNLNLFTK